MWKNGCAWLGLNSLILVSMLFAGAAMAIVSTQNTDVITASYGRPIVLAYGRHVVGGNVILQDESDPNNTILFLALGEGPWDGIDELNVNGEDIDLATSTIYHFHKGLAGQLSSGGDLTPEGVGSPYPFATDGDQKADLFTPDGIQGLTFSKTAYIALKIPFDQNAPSAQVAVWGIYRTRQVRIFNSLGVQTAFQFSDNPAWQIADLLTTVRGLPDSRIDWASFKAAADYCDTLISINGVDVKRFISNVAFTQQVNLDQALNALLATCRGFLTDIAGLISLRIDQARASVFDFAMDNILEGTFSAQYQDTRAVANRLQMSFRDTDNDYQLAAKDWNDEAQQARTGRVVAAQLDLGNMPQHQAERIGDYLLTRAIDNNPYAKLRGDKSSLAVMPGDVVRVKHDAAPWGAAPGDSLFSSFEVIDVAENPDETRDFNLQAYSAATYPDTAGPTQNLIATNLNRSMGDVPAPVNWVLTANLAGDLRLALSVAEGADYRSGDLTLLVDEEDLRAAPGTTTLAANVGTGDASIQLTDASAFLVGDEISISENGVPAAASVEILKITGPGPLGAAPTSNTVTVDRAQRGTAAIARTAGDGVYRLTQVVEHFVFPPNYSVEHPTHDLANSAQYFVKRFQPGRMRILYASMVINGLRYSSPAVTALFNGFGFEPKVDGTLPGLRVSDGGQETIIVSGPLQAGAASADPIVFQTGPTLGPIFASLASLSAGSVDVKGHLEIDDGAGGWTAWGPQFAIPAAVDGLGTGSGTFASGSQTGAVSGRIFRLVIDQIGDGTDPGTDLTVYLPY